MALAETAQRPLLKNREPALARTLAGLLDLQLQIDELGESSSLRTTLRGMTLVDMIETLQRLVPGAPQTVRAPSPVTGRSLVPLSDRELEVVRLVAEGLSNKEISSRLKLSDKTIKNHISHILSKMNLTARTQVAVYAIRAGLV